jgi:hypothetical protein
MPSVREEQKYAVSADEMWGRIGDFHALSAWHPAIASQTADGGPKVRELHLDGGGTVVETLLSAGPRTYTYSIDASPLPVADYTATISVAGADAGCLVTWVADFRADGASDEDAAGVIAGIFRTGLDALAK